MHSPLKSSFIFVFFKNVEKKKYPINPGLILPCFKRPGPDIVSYIFKLNM